MRSAPMSAATTFDWLMPAPARTPNSPYEIPEILAMLPPASTLSSSMPKPVWACPRMLPMFRPATRLVSEMPKPAMLPKVLMLARSRVATIEVVSMLPSVTVIGPISVPRRYESEIPPAGIEIGPRVPPATIDVPSIP